MAYDGARSRWVGLSGHGRGISELAVLAARFDNAPYGIYNIASKGLNENTASKEVPSANKEPTESVTGYLAASILEKSHNYRAWRSS